MGISANQARLLTLTARQSDLELRAQQISAQKMVLSLQSQQWATKYSSALNDYMSSGQTSASNGHWVYSEATAEDWTKWLSSNSYYVLNISDKSAYTGSNYTEALNSGYAVYKKVTTTTTTAGSSSSTPTAADYARAAGMDEAAVKAAYIAEVARFYSSNQVTRFNNNVKNTSLDNIIISDGKMAYKDLSDLTVSLSAVFGDVNPSAGETVTTTTYVEVTSRPQHAEWVSDNNSSSTGDVSIETIKAEYDSAVAQLSSIEKLLDMELTQINTEHQAVKTEYDSVKSLIGDNTEKSFNIFG